MFLFLETDRREQKKCEKTIQILMDNTVNVLSETLFFYFKQKYISFLKGYFFLLRQMLKNIDMPRQKP